MKQKRVLRITFFILILFILILPSAFAVAGPKSSINTDFIADGYVQVKFTEKTEKAVKVRIEKGNESYTYDLNPKGELETYPLQMGDGKYDIKVFLNTTGNRYSVVQTLSVDVKLKDEFAPYLAANQYVNYTADSEAIKKAEELSRGTKSGLEKIQKIYAFVIDAISYDTEKAKTVEAGYLPDIDAVLKAKKGICFDYAALLAAMLRSQGIPTKLVTGYVAPDQIYHSWNEVYLKETGWVKVTPFSFPFDGKSWRLMDPTFSSAARDSKKVAEFIGNGTNYTVKYYY